MAPPTRDDGYATTSGVVNAAGHVEVACGGALLRIETRKDVSCLAARARALGRTCRRSRRRVRMCQARRFTEEIGRGRAGGLGGRCDPPLGRWVAAPSLTPRVGLGTRTSG